MIVLLSFINSDTIIFVENHDKYMSQESFCFVHYIPNTIVYHESYDLKWKIRI